MWSWLQIGVFMLLIFLIFGLVVYTCVQNYKVTEIDNRISGEDRAEPDIDVTEERENNNDDDDNYNNYNNSAEENNIDFGYVSD